MKFHAILSSQNEDVYEKGTFAQNILLYNAQSISMQEAKCGLEMLAKAGMKKINFSGGEPFLIKWVVIH